MISGLAFSGFHFISPEFNLVTFILLFVFGMVFMYMYLLVGSIWPVIMFHLGWDVLAEYFAFYSNVLYCLLCFGIVLIILVILKKKVFNKNLNENSDCYIS